MTPAYTRAISLVPGPQYLLEAGAKSVGVPGMGINHHLSTWTRESREKSGFRCRLV